MGAAESARHPLAQREDAPSQLPSPAPRSVPRPRRARAVRGCAGIRHRPSAMRGGASRARPAPRRHRPTARYAEIALSVRASTPSPSGRGQPAQSRRRSPARARAPGAWSTRARPLYARTSSLPTPRAAEPPERGRAQCEYRDCNATPATPACLGSPRREPPPVDRTPPPAPASDPCSARSPSPGTRCQTPSAP